jgi:hypothetical protein
MHKPDPVTGDYSRQCHFAIMENINLSVPWYLSVSLAYYEYDVSLITDALYDKMTILMREFWDDIKHRHKHLIDKEGLNAGTAFYIKEINMPSIVVYSTRSMVKEYDDALQARAKGNEPDTAN